MSDEQYQRMCAMMVYARRSQGRFAREVHDEAVEIAASVEPSPHATWRIMQYCSADVLRAYLGANGPGALKDIRPDYNRPLSSALKSLDPTDRTMQEVCDIVALFKPHLTDTIEIICEDILDMAHPHDRPDLMVPLWDTFSVPPVEQDLLALEVWTPPSKYAFREWKANYRHHGFNLSEEDWARLIRDPRNPETRWRSAAIALKKGIDIRPMCKPSTNPRAHPWLRAFADRLSSSHGMIQYFSNMPPIEDILAMNEDQIMELLGGPQ